MAGSFSAKDIPAKGLTELDRLAFTVRKVDSQCTIVPVGSFKRTPLGEVQKNEAFRGLKHGDAGKLESYMHFRVPHQADKKAQSARKDDVFVADFLDNAACVKNKGGWTVGRDVSQNVAIMRSRLWPGFVSYHRANSGVHGCFYLGNGIKNADLAFML